MELGDVFSLRSPAPSKTKVALEFLRVDKARFNSGRTPIPLPKAVVERQRKRMVNKRFMACMKARRQTLRENEDKQRDNREVVIKDLKSNETKPNHDNPETRLLPWPGFRYHNNGDVRTLNNIQKQRRLLASMKAGQGHRQSTVEMPFLSRTDSSETKPKSSTMIKNRSLDSLKTLMNKRSVSGRFSFDSLPTQFNTSTTESIGLDSQSSRVPSVTNRRQLGQGTSSNSDIRGKLSPVFERKVSSNKFNVYGVPSNRSIGRLNLNQFGPAVKPLTTSSMWCNGVEELMERASLIPKDSFNIRFGVSSKMLHQRKSDLDEYRLVEEKRSLENAKNIKKYIEGVKKQMN